MNEPSGIEAAALKPCPFCGSEAEIERYGDHSRSTIYQCTSCSCILESGEEWGHGRRWNERANPAASGDLRERIARLWQDILDKDDRTSPEEYPDMALITSDEFRDAILASLPGLDEKAEAPGWHTTGWDRARNSGRILLVWREVSGVKEHVELGWYSDSKVSWVNTYGRPFSGEPDGWAPLQPFRSLKTGRGE